MAGNFVDLSRNRVIERDPLLQSVGNGFDRTPCAFRWEFGRQGSESRRQRQTASDDLGHPVGYRDLFILTQTDRVSGRWLTRSLSMRIPGDLTDFNDMQSVLQQAGDSNVAVFGFDHALGLNVFLVGGLVMETRHDAEKVAGVDWGQSWERESSRSMIGRNSERQ